MPLNAEIEKAPDASFNDYTVNPFAPHGLLELLDSAMAAKLRSA